MTILLLGELRSINSEDIKGYTKYVEILTNTNSMPRFLSGEKEIKILLHTSDDYTESVCLKLFEMAKPLTNFGIKIGVAVKSISPKFELCIKVRGKISCYDIPEEIPYILSIIGVAAGIGMNNEKMFISMNAEVCFTKLPIINKEDFLNINLLIEKLLPLKDVIVSNSHLETSIMLTKLDNKLRFFIPIDAKLTSFLAMTNIQKLLTFEINRDVEWVAGSLEIPQIFATGLIFIVKNSQVLAVCLDELDIMILIENLSSKFDQCLEILSPRNMKNSFYPDRAFSSEKIIKTLELKKHKNLEITDYGLESFNEDSNGDLLNALELTLSYISGDEVNIIATVAKFAIKENKDLDALLLKAGYSSTETKFYKNILNQEAKSKLAESIEENLRNKNPFSIKINLAKKTLNDIINTDESDKIIQKQKIDNILNSITKDKDCPINLKKSLEIIDDDLNLDHRCYRTKSIIEKYENEEERMEKVFHTKILHSLLINNLDNYISDVLKRYIDKITLVENIFESARSRFNEDLEQKLYFHLKVHLAECSYGVKYYLLHEGNEYIIDE